ncbi:MAG TPA: cbb3-type cytochrome c oxidase subunit 3 [Alphaproteobacteria bacterium]|nr:cbb3-type cytochrome c oxidase subunit 3 [Alphaproteobacteria bacterium]
MDFETLYPYLRSLWTVWFFALFVGIVAWALWPSRKSKLEEHGRIPLRDDN